MWSPLRVKSSGQGKRGWRVDASHEGLPKGTARKLASKAELVHVGSDPAVTHPRR